jgi:hypothetical protein
VKERDHLKDIDVCGITLNWIGGCGQDLLGSQQALLNTGKNLQVP